MKGKTISQKTLDLLAILKVFSCKNDSQELKSSYLPTSYTAGGLSVLNNFPLGVMNELYVYYPVKITERAWEKRLRGFSRLVFYSRKRMC